jgi:hypothetical protein
MKTESKIQQEIVMWFRNNYCLKHNIPRCAIFSVPNERKDTRELMKMKATGLMAGVSDLIIAIPSKVLFVEVKDDKGRQSDKQKYFEESIKGLNLEYYLVRSLEDFQNIIKKNL